MNRAQLMKVLHKDKFRTGAALFVCWLTTFAISFLVLRAPGDDAKYARELRRMNGIQWVIMRYKTWSGRVFSEISAAFTVPFPQTVWRFFNALFLTLLVYSIARIAFHRVRASSVLFVYAAYWLLAPTILLNSSFWLAGAVVYLWPASLAVFSGILLSDAVRGQNTKYKFLYVIAAFLASMGVEQVGPCVVAFSLITLIYLYVKQHKVNVGVAANACASIVGLVIELVCPGSRLRSVSETKHWYPNFDQLSVMTKIHKGVVWQYGEVANYLFGLIAFTTVAAVVSIIAYQHNEHAASAQDDSSLNEQRTLQPLDYGLMGVIVGQLILLVAEPKMQLWTSLFIFKVHSPGEPVADWLFPYIFWTVFIVCLVALLMRFLEQKYVVLFLALASLCAGMVMYFSPTIYATGARSMYVSAVLIIIILAMIQSKFRNKVIYIAVFIPAVLNIISFVTRIMRVGYQLYIFG
ncbi:DUF6056 family protein [Bifidobacterium sp. ESL0769]|uniref:DUF6056 family protein n=1 Tax=Bifidobacterium sp. ESL0769 TaxID=2983229 RepID=UPI0023F71BC8|nr:DUF6056 family protein [Bifidobacterium sp. ESL0769]WEV67248.1 DUF6056 family protein [Bifidobacterium sp. ESL0769]